MKRQPRGIFEKVPGSSVWWIRFADAVGRIRREKVGSKSAALKLYQKRKVEILEGKKLPQQLRVRVIAFEEIANDAIRYAKSNNIGWKSDCGRIRTLIRHFSGSPAEIPVTDLRRFFEEHKGWKDGTYNRYRGNLSLIYRLAIESGKVTTNPARLLRRKAENNGRVRFLAAEEESRLRAIIHAKYPEHEPEFGIAIHTGLRRGEQYGLTWDCVDLGRRQVTVLRSKNGEIRHVPLNSDAVTAFRILYEKSSSAGPVFVSLRSDGLRNARHWFERAVSEAQIPDFTWHCLRHTFASRLVMAGVDLRTVQQLMGHKTIQMTCRYAHLAPEHQLAAVERLATKPTTETAINVPTDTRTDTVAERSHTASPGRVQ